MNAYELLIRVRDDLGEAAAANWTDRQLVRWLTRAYRIAHAEQVELIHNFMLETGYVDIVADQESYSLPADLYKIHCVEIGDGAAEQTYTKLADTIIAERWKYVGKASFSLSPTMMRWYLDGKNIGVVPKPSSARTNGLKITYIPQPGELHTGLIAAADATTVTLQTSETAAEGPASGDDDAYNGQDLYIVSGTGMGTKAEITDYEGLTKVATVTMPTTPAAGSRYALVPKTEPQFDELIINKACQLASFRQDPVVADRFSGLHDVHRRQIKTALEVRKHGPDFVRTGTRDYELYRRR
jgi:hypothetical protein